MLGSSPMHQVKLAGLRQWLQEHGADVGAIEIGDDKDGVGTGMSATEAIAKKYAPHLWRRITNWFRPNRFSEIASFPTSLLINEHAVVKDSLLGETLQAHIARGDIDGEAAVMLWLLMHRRMGPSSPFAPYIAVLPRTFSTPLHYSPEELQQLRGTSLVGGVAFTERRLAASLRHAQPIAHELQSRIGFALRDFSPEDWKWAFSVFWSRCVELGSSDAPTLAAAASGASARDGKTTVGNSAAGGKGDSASGGKGAAGNDAAGSAVTRVVSLVPGLDMSNHSSEAQCYWEVEAGEEAGAGRVKLMARVRGGPRAGDSVRIRYGDGTNDGLLFSHGFAELDNQNDAAVVRFPLPEDLDELLQARLLLLQENGLGPFITLARPEAGKSSELSQDSRKAIEVFVMPPSELAAELEKGDEQKAASGPTPQQPALVSMGQDMAVYTTLCTLLEVTLNDLEGPEGTGPLQDDVRLVEAGPEGVSDTVWQCIVYRAAQKRIVRQHLDDARKQLQLVMNRMHSAIDKK